MTPGSNSIFTSTLSKGSRQQYRCWGTSPPSLSPYVCVSRTQTKLIWERNPYYFKVDSKGKQLPYIDRVINEHVPEKEIISGKIISGEVDFEGFMTTTPEIPLFRKYEKQGDYHADIWNFAANSTVYHLNYSYNDRVVRYLFRNRTFRIALSHAINRERINNEILFGKARPVRMTVLPNTKWFKPEYETKYVEYDPEKAKTLLDEIGVTDKDGDGWREDKDGNDIHWQIEFMVSEAPRVPIAELTKENWRAIGLNVDVQVREATLAFERVDTNDMAMWIWHGDARTETLFPAYVNVHIFPGRIGVSWHEWYFSADKSVGEEPPQEVKDVYDAFIKMEQATSEKEVVKWGRVMLDSAADNLWVIGTCNDFPHPMIVKNDLLNFPTEKDGPLLYIWTTWWTNAYEPAQFFFKNRPQVPFKESGLPKIYPVDKRKDPVTRAIKEGWL